MKTRRLWKVCAHLTLACLIAGAAAAQEHDLSLERYVGKSPDRQFLALPAVHDPLARLLGHRLQTFLSRLQVVTPIDRVSRDIVAQGCVRDNCAAEQAAFTIDLDTGAAAAASLTQGRYMDIYSKNTTTYNDLPPGLRRWISSRTSRSPQFKHLKFRFFK
jgi:hypothetical protein